MIGVLDWGIGGLFSVARLRARWPTADVVVLTDAGSEPYGRQDRRALCGSVDRALARLRALGATRILVACHSASSVLPRLDAPDAVGVIAPQHVPRGGRLAVLGGTRTVRSRVWRRALRGHGEVVQRIAQPLSARVERGDVDSAATRAAVRRVLRPLPAVDTLVLACTHYIALEAVFAEVRPAVRIVDPALAVVDGWTAPGGTGRLEVHTTGDARAVQRVMDRLVPGLGAVVDGVRPAVAGRRSAAAAGAPSEG